ncbi:MAG: GNAT family N-acetyltransferase [Bacteroidota bacterium]
MITLRPATIADLDLVQYWDTKQHVIDCDPDDDGWVWAQELVRNPEWREQLIAELNGEPLGFIQIIDPYLEETHYWGPIAPHKRAIDIWIGEEHHLNKGYGTRMMELAIAKCFSDKSVDSILIDPLKTNTKAQTFYKRLGFQFVEERDFGGTTCMVYELKRDKPA